MCCVPQPSWLEGALESGKCYRTCRFWQQCAEHTIVLLRAHKGLSGYGHERIEGRRASPEENIISHLDIQIINKHNKKYPRLFAYADNLVGSGAGLAPRTGSS